MRTAVVIVAVLSAGCTDPPASEPKPAPKAAEQAALDEAKAAAKKLGSGLKKELQRALANGEPADALQVCATRAQPITAEVRGKTDVTVGRSSLRLRNPKNKAPAWVQAWLDAQGERKAAGVEGIARIDDTPGGKVARFLAPITIEGPCLNCHGAPDSLAPPVRDTLAERYPDDAATGYAPGDLRGALWAEAKVESSS